VQNEAMNQTLLKALDPDADVLLSAISAHVTDDVLSEIALADGGEDEECHFSSLRRIRDRGRIVEPLEWCPSEVLCLIRNSEPDWPSATLPSEIARIRGHWMRAFAAAALLRATHSPWNYDGASTEAPGGTLIRLIRSNAVLPVDFSLELVRFLAWAIADSDPEKIDAEDIFSGVTLLWLTLKLKRPVPDEYLISFAEWIVRQEAEIRDKAPHAFDWHIPSRGFHSPLSRWEGLGAKLRELDLSGNAKALQALVSVIGSESTADRPMH
jgi:hypothetical protein